MVYGISRADSVDGLRRLCVGLFAFLVGNVGAATLDGLYHGMINGVPSSLDLQVADDQLNGEIDAGGYKYTLHGRISGPAAEGVFSDPASGGSGNFRAMQDGDRVRLELQLGGQPIVLWFESNPDGLPGQSAHAGTGREAATQQDPVLVGRWRQTESMTSGDFTGVVQTFMSILPDGSFQYGDGRFVGGGPGIGGSSGGGDVSVGEWRTENSVVYIREPGQPNWSPFARYHVEGARLLFTFGDGSRQLWSRVQ